MTVEQEKLAKWLGDEIKGRLGSPLPELNAATADAVKAHLLDISRDFSSPSGEITVAADPDNPGCFIITGTGDYADWVRRAHELAEAEKARQEP